MTLLGLWLAPLAVAEMPLPDYRDALVQRTWYQVNALLEAGCETHPSTGHTVCEPEPLRAAIEKAQAWQGAVVRDARLEYLTGLAHKNLGEQRAAERFLRSAVTLDPDRADAWHDLGELYLAQARFEEAREAFGNVQRLIATGPRAWIGPWRLAEVAAHERDPEAFERHMRQALERGFSFRLIRGLPNWQQFYADPAMRDSIEKLVTVYGDPAVLDTLRAPPPAP